MTGRKVPPSGAQATADAPPPRTLAGLASSLRVAVGRLNRRIRYEREDDSLTLNQLSTLGQLDKHGPTPIGELAAIERIRPPSMTRIVAGLEELGLVTRDPDIADRRMVRVCLTEVGRSRMAADRKRREAWLAQRLRELSPEERKQLRDVLPLLERLARS